MPKSEARSGVTFASESTTYSLLLGQRDAIGVAVDS
jgi:hypothetical protein